MVRHELRKTTSADQLIIRDHGVMLLGICKQLPRCILICDGVKPLKFTWTRVEVATGAHAESAFGELQGM
jgi:hypothetical protein